MYVSYCKNSFWFNLCKKKARLLVEVFCLFEKFYLKRLFSIGSWSCRSLTKINVGVPLFVSFIMQKEFLVWLVSKKFASYLKFFAYLKKQYFKTSFFNQVLQLSKANEKQRMSPTLCMCPIAKTVFGLTCVKKKLVY